VNPSGDTERQPCVPGDQLPHTVQPIILDPYHASNRARTYRTEDLGSLPGPASVAARRQALERASAFKTEKQKKVEMEDIRRRTIMVHLDLEVG
jgi:hypothetical protein